MLHTLASNLNATKTRVLPTIRTCNPGYAGARCVPVSSTRGLDRPQRPLQVGCQLDSAGPSARRSDRCSHAFSELGVGGGSQTASDLFRRPEPRALSGADATPCVLQLDAEAKTCRQHSKDVLCLAWQAYRGGGTACFTGNTALWRAMTSLIVLLGRCPGPHAETVAKVQGVHVS